MEQTTARFTKPWSEPVRGGYPDISFLARPGLEQFRAFVTGDVVAPPIHHLTGLRPTQVGPGQATFVLPVSGWWLPPMGVIDATMFSVLADGPLGGALHTALPAMTPYSTAEISMSYVRPAAHHGQLVCRGSLVHMGKTLGLTQASIEDGEGRLVAHATSRLVIQAPLGPAPANPPPLRPPEKKKHATPDPYERPPQGETLGQDIWDDQTGLEIMQALVEGKLPLPPVSHITGKRPVSAAEGRCSFAMPATEWHNSPFPRMEGGFIAMLADSAQNGAVQTVTGKRTIFAPLDLKVNFLRPVSADGKDIRADAEVIHVGKSIIATRATVYNADGKPVAVSSGTASVHKDRAWADLAKQA